MERSKPRRSVLHVFGWIGYSLFLVAIAVGSTVYGWARHVAPSFTDAAIRQVVAPAPPRAVFKADALNVLLLGCDDSFTPSGQVVQGPSRSDMMMVVRVDFVRGTVSGLSIPRDTMMSLKGPNEHPHRINAFHAFGGALLSQKAVEWLTKVKIDRVAKIDSWQFMEMVNSLGGVTVDSPKELEYTDHADGLYIRIKKGRNDLNGYESLGFVRFRHGDDDIARGQRQRSFLLALRERMKSNPTHALQAANRLVPLFSEAFTQDELLSLIRMGVGISSTRIKMAGWPVRAITNTGTVVTDRTKVAEVLDSLGMKATIGDPTDATPDREGGDTTSPSKDSGASKIDVAPDGAGHDPSP